MKSIRVERSPLQARCLFCPHFSHWVCRTPPVRPRRPIHLAFWRPAKSWTIRGSVQSVLSMINTILGRPRRPRLNGKSRPARSASGFWSPRDCGPCLPKNRLRPSFTAASTGAITRSKRCFSPACRGIMFRAIFIGPPTLRESFPACFARTVTGRMAAFTTRDRRKQNRN